jgi:hypothetical protein
MFAAIAATAAEPLVVPLWPNGAPGFEDRRNEPERWQGGSVSNIHNPSITVFLPPKEKANGAAVLISSRRWPPRVGFQCRGGRTGPLLE